LHTRVPKPYFPLTITLDPNGIEWTHLIGVQRHVRTPDELPSALEAQILPVITKIAKGKIQEFVVGKDAIEKATKNALDILHLTAWWLEWDRRRMIAHREFTCTHCASSVKIVKLGMRRVDPSSLKLRGADKHIYRCPNSACPTHALVAIATGDPILTVVEEAESA